nr:hypothetical protein [Tanacetum cinerariifolium]
MKHQGHPRCMEELHIKRVLALGLALMMGRLVVLWPFCGISSRFHRNRTILRTFFVMVHVHKVCSYKQQFVIRSPSLFKQTAFLSIVGPAYSQGEILFLGYKWRLEKCLHFIKFKSKKLSTSTYGYGCCKQAFCNCCRNGQLQNLIQESRRVLNLFLRSVRTLDPDLKEARIRAARERIEDLEGRQQALRAEQEDLIVRVVTRHGHRGD